MNVEIETTLTIAGDEQDVAVRGSVWFDGRDAIPEDVRAFVNGAWVPFDDLGIDADERDRVEEALCEAAHEETYERAAYAADMWRDNDGRR